MSDVIYLLVGLIIGIVIGASVVLVVSYFKKQYFLNTIKDYFGTISREVLKESREDNINIAKSELSKESALGAKELESKKELIKERLVSMEKEIRKVMDDIKGFEKDRNTKYGELSNLLRNTGNELNRLHTTTGKLNEALASTTVRGLWGAEMANRVLELAGFIENINYYREKTLQYSQTRPDFTFPLSNDYIVNMDVKFPLDNYKKYLNEQNDVEKDRFRSQFFKDVRKHIRDVKGRSYISKEDKTIDMVIVFIPVEAVYSFIIETDRFIMDEAMKNNVALCGPLNLFGILAVIRKAVDNFNLEKAAGQIISLMGGFEKQWQLFIQSMDNMGKRIEAAQREYDKLVTTRKNQLQKPLDKIEALRKQKGLPVSEIGEIEFNEESPVDDDDNDLPL